MDWTAQIDIYCERQDASFWAEPLNAISNVAFILAGLWAAFEARRRGGMGWPVVFLIGMAFVIGAGSFLFHTFATHWAGLADSLPILIFILSYAVAALALIVGARRLQLLLYLVAMAAFFTATGLAISALGLDMNGSQGYLPALLSMYLITALTWARGHPVLPWFAAATLAFTLSLTLRSLDMALCDAWPYGTHVFWHLFNGTVVALLLQALIRNTRKASAP
ncbi:MAG: hypothetical protein HKN30_11025 [Sulfitobacter sp.]|nr:hypothetical protein [Sulfitobacter sp.]